MSRIQLRFLANFIINNNLFAYWYVRNRNSRNCSPAYGSRSPGGLSSIDVRADQPSSSPYLTINRAVIVQSGLDAIITTNDRIPTDGSGGAFGYGSYF